MKTTRSVPLLLAVLLGATVGSAAAASLADRLPGDARIIGALRLAALRQSPLFDLKDLRKEKLPGEAGDIQGWLDAVGIDLAKDIDEVAFATAEETAGEDGIVVLAAGRLDAARIRTAATAKGAKPVALAAMVPGVKGPTSVPVDALRLPATATQGEAVLLSFLGADTLVLGTQKATLRVHELAGGATSVSDPSRRGAIPADAVMWVVAEGKDTATASQLQGMGGLEGVALWATVKDVLDLHGVAHAPDAATATQLVATLQLATTFAALAPSATGQTGPSPMAALSGLRFEAAGSRISARLTLTKAQLDALEPKPSGASKTTGG